MWPVGMIRPAFMLSIRAARNVWQSALINMNPSDNGLAVKGYVSKQVCFACGRRIFKKNAVYQGALTFAISLPLGGHPVLVCVLCRIIQRTKVLNIMVGAYFDQGVRYL